MFELFVGSDAVRRQMQDALGLEPPRTGAQVDEGRRRRRLFVRREASDASRLALIGRVSPMRRESSRRRPCPEGADS